MDFFTPILFALGFCHEFAIECGCLRCYALRVGRRRWKLEFAVFVTRHHGNSTMERRLVGSELLQERLREAGFPVEYEGHWLYPSLGCTLRPCLPPRQIRRRMEQIVAANECLWVDPEPGEWQRYLESGRRRLTG